MKTKFTTLALTLLLGGAPLAQAQELTQAAKSRTEILAAAKDVMANARYCGLVTLNENEPPRARVVDPFPPESDMTVWVGTKPVTRKVADIERNDRVTLLCIAPGGSGYVTLMGHAEVVRDPVEKARHWKPDWTQFYEDEHRGDDYVLIRVRTHHVEIVSAPHGMMNDPQTWRPVSLDLHR